MEQKGRVRDCRRSVQVDQAHPGQCALHQRKAPQTVDEEEGAANEFKQRRQVVAVEEHADGRHGEQHVEQVAEDGQGAQSLQFKLFYFLKIFFEETF